MYDRGSDTPSLWLQATGEAVVGPKTGISLDRVPTTQAPWGEWKVAHPNTTVLSKETGHRYSYNPYPDILEPVTKTDSRCSCGAMNRRRIFLRTCVRCRLSTMSLTAFQLS